VVVNGKSTFKLSSTVTGLNGRNA